MKIKRGPGQEFLSREKFAQGEKRSLVQPSYSPDNERKSFIP